ncbi:MAG TPA: protein kinase [Kofleriaceae bacterium]|nr:protein kinase [Kofleriaceae bacterium]
MSEPPDSTVQSGGDVAHSVDGDEAYCAACGQSYPVDKDVCDKDGSRLTKLKARPDSLLGRVFDGRYEIRATLGQGGMGTVYRGWQLSVDREVAVKVIHPKLASDRTAVKRFLREVRLASRLSHPAIVNVYDFGQTDDGILYLVMELLRGHTLAQDLLSQRPLSAKRFQTIALQLCDALDVAHAQSIVHRDLKPGNIVILDDPPGRDLLKVLDFGLAKSLVSDTSSVVTNTSAILGTPLYMAPEQIQSAPTDQRADLYSLGCILYQLATGRPPFIGETVNQVLSMHLHTEPPPLPASVEPAIARTIAQLMRKDPGSRPLSAASVRASLEQAAATTTTTPVPSPALATTAPHPGLAVTAPAIDATPVSSPAPARRRWLPAALATLVLGGGGAAIWALRDRGDDNHVAASPSAAAATDAAVRPADALVIDGAVRPPIDAAPSVDADAPIDASAPGDAGRKRPPLPGRPPRTPNPPQVPRDAGSTPRPDAALEFYGLDGGS